MKWLILFLFTVLGYFGNGTRSKQNPPNIVLIFFDDMGYGDLGCYGALDVSTPHMDQLAMEGIRFTNFLTAQAVCSASRAALLTGCYPNRIGISGALFPNAPNGIRAGEMTLAEMLKQKNYHTGIFGKWHLGDKKEFLPLQHGFDEYFGLPYSNDMWPVHYDGTPATDWKKDRFPPLPLMEGNESISIIKNHEEQGTLTKQYTQRAVSFIENNRKHPFFLYLPHSMPHVPIAASSGFKGKSKQGPYGDVIMELDWSVGKVLQALKENKLEKNTLVIVTSDNGPWFNYGNHAGSSGGFREGKGTSFEGGHRVPCIVRWPGKLPQGKICNQLCSTLDLFPTLASLSGSSLPQHKIDGIDILSLFMNPEGPSPREVFYYYYRRNALEAVRKGNWKLVLPHPGRSYENQLPGKDGFPGAAPEDVAIAPGLYDLRRDPAERYDVHAANPGIVGELTALAEAARDDLGDDLTGKKGKNVRSN